MAVLYKLPRNTKAALDAKASGNTLVPYQQYFLTDTNRVAVATATNAYIQLPNSTEIGGSGGVSDGDKGDITVSASGATWTVDAGAISYSKLQTNTSQYVLGSNTTGSGSPVALREGPAASVTGSFINTTSVFGSNTSLSVASIISGKIHVIANGATVTLPTISEMQTGYGSQSFNIFFICSSGTATVAASAVDGNAILDVTKANGVLNTTVTAGQVLCLMWDGSNLKWAIIYKTTPSSSSTIPDGDKGDITVASGVWSIDSGVVTYAKLQAASTGSVILARAATSAGAYAELPVSTGQLVGSRADTGVLSSIALGTGLSMSGATLSASVPEPLPLPTEVVNDVPDANTPTTGIRIFASKRANRRMLGYQTPTGRTERMQVFIGSNDLMLVDVSQGVAGYQTLGTTMATDVGTVTTPTITTTNVLTMQPRRVLSVAATVNLMMEAKSTQPFCSRRLVGGGFHFTTRFGLETVLPATGRLFAGFNGSATAIASGDPLGTLVNAVGLYKNSSDTTLSMMISATAGANFAATLTNTGAVGWNVAGTMFQLELFAAAGDTQIGYRVIRYTPNGANTPTVAMDDGVLSGANLPAIDTLFYPHIWAQNVAATATSLAIIQMYKESD